MRAGAIRAVRGAALAAALAWTGVAAAQDASSTAPSPPPSPAVPGEPVEVTVRGRRQTDSSPATRAVTSLGEAEIRDASPGSLADALRGRPGVAIQQTTPGQGTVYVRGMAGRETVVLLDGVRLNTAVFRSPNNAALTVVDPYALQSVDVIRGPSSVLHGSDALGGVVSLATPLPSYASERDRSRVDLLSSVTGNPAGMVARLSGRHQARAWAAHVGATFLQYGNVTPGEGLRSPDPASYAWLERDASAAYRPATDREQIGTGYQRLALDAVLRHRVGEHGELVWRAQAAERPRLTRYDEITPRFASAGWPARAESSLSHLRRTMVSLTYVHRPKGAFYESTTATLAWQRLGEEQGRRTMDEVCATGGGAAACTTRLRLVPQSTLRRETTLVDSLSARGEVRLASRDKVLGAVVGLEGIHERVQSRADRIDTALGAVSDDASRYPDGSTMTQGGAFAQLEVAPTPRLRAHAGARAAVFALDIPARGLAGVDPSLTDRTVRSLGDVALTAGARFEAARGIGVVANAGRGVRSPNVEDFAGAGTRAGGRTQIPNRGLTPEHAQSADLGLKIARGPLVAETFVFVLRFDDAIGLRTVGSAADGTRLVQSANASRLDLYGVESEIRVERESTGGVYARGVALGDSERAEPGVSAAERVRVPAQGVLGAFFHPTPTVRIEAFAHARGPARRVTNPSDNRIPAGGTPGFVTLHARAVWQASPSLLGRLALDNLADTLAVEHGSGFALAGFSATIGVEGRLER